MSAEDEKILLNNGPLPCIWKNYANELICTPQCGNFQEVRRQLIEAQKRAQQGGTTISIREMVEGIRTGKYGILQPEKLSRPECREQPKIPVISIELKSNF